MDIEEVLDKLKGMIDANGFYKAFFAMYYSNYMRKGSFFLHCVPDGIELSLIYLRSIEAEIIFKKKKMPFMICLEKLTLHFSVRCGYSKEEWKQLVEYLVVSNSRIFNPAITTVELKDKEQLLLNNPFIVTLLLIEALHPW
jgi:hypothetical protein